VTGLGTFVDDDSEEVLQITSLEYTEEHGDTIVHLFCRTRDHPTVSPTQATRSSP